MLGHVLRQSQEASLGIVPGICVQLLIIWIQRLDDARDTKFEVPFGTIQRADHYIVHIINQKALVRNKVVGRLPRLTMQRWKHCLSGSAKPIRSSSFSILRIKSSASSFCDVII